MSRPTNQGNSIKEHTNDHYVSINRCKELKSLLLSSLNRISMNDDLITQFGNIDIYLFDQLLKGTFDGCKTVMDTGCGGGRNIYYFLKQGYEVYGVDTNPEAVDQVRMMARELAPSLPAENFVATAIETMPFEALFFDLVISSAVLHFAKDKSHFETMLHRCWQVVKPGGYFFCRLASSIGIEKEIIAIGNGRYLLPDGSERYLVDETDLLHYTHQLGGQLFEPIKTTNVQGMRCMTTWCVQKG
jgi:tellurite methyltransferase